MIDDREETAYFRTQTRNVLITSGVGLLIIIACSVLLSKWLTKPTAKAFQQQKQFVADASHELKTPIAVISANAQRLQSEIGDNKWLHYILEEDKRMEGLLKELLTLARVEEGIPGEAFAKVNLTRTVTRALLPYESIAYERGVEFWMDVQEDVEINGEEEHLKQMVIILTDNAFHHVSDGGEVKVSLHRRKKRVEIAVSNTGAEIPKEEQEKIYQRFYRVDKGRNRSENRYGLGLAIASKIAERHRGKLFVVSENGITVFTCQMGM